MHECSSNVLLNPWNIPIQPSIGWPRLVWEKELLLENLMAQLFFRYSGGREGQVLTDSHSHSQKLF